MPSLREKVTTYFRQLSFIAEPRDGRHLSPRKVNEDGFVTKHLEGRLENIFSPGPDIKHGQNPNDLPDLQLSYYPTGPKTISAACTGPDEGLTGIKRSKLHLSAGSDIDFIDTNHDQELEVRKSSISNQKNSRYSTAAQKYRSDQNANTKPGVGVVIRSRKNSRVGDSATTPTGGVSSGIDKLSLEKIETDSNTNTINVIVSMVNTKQIASLTTASATITTTTTTTTSSPVISGIDEKTTKTVISELQTGAVLSDNNIVKSCEIGKENMSPNEKTDQMLRETLLERNLNQTISVAGSANEPIAGVKNWNLENDHAYGISISLYEKNFLTNESMGSPVADCFGLVVRNNSAVLALADGVNWGEGARLAARSAVQGSLEYLDTAIFGLSQGCMATTTRDVFVSLLRSFWEAHACILEVGGALSTLSVAIVLPLDNPNRGKFVVCACNVGDSLGYVYSKKHGVREFTQGSHDITSNRDMRDALGALGPVDGNKPELSNLTLSMTIVDAGDIVFLTSDGISDNFDPVVGKFAEPYPPNFQSKKIDSQLAPKRQNKSTSAIHSRSSTVETKIRTYSETEQTASSSSSSSAHSAPPVRPPRSKKLQSQQSLSLSQSHPHQQHHHNHQNQQQASFSAASRIAAAPSRPKYMRSHTVIEPRVSLHKSSPPAIKIPRSAAGLPYVTGPQRHSLTLRRLEDLLSYGINGTLRPCPSARKLCTLLLDFVRMITSARRKTLEQRELFYKLVTKPDGTKEEVEMTRIQHRAARKRIVDGNTFQSLPGKLDHASVVAFTVGSGLQPTEFNETSF